MASNRIKGITITIDGDTTGLQKSLKEVDKTIKTTQNNLKDVNKLLKLDPTNTELLRQKQEYLNTSIEETKKRLNTLKDAYKELDGKNTDEAKEQQKALAREIVDTEQNLKSLKEQYRDFGSVAKQQLTVVGEKFKEVGGKITNVGQSLTTKVTLPIIGVFAAGVNAASDYEENLNKLQVAFGDFADEVREFTDNAQLDYGLSKKDASDSASAFGALAKGIGLADETAAEMAVTLTGLSSDLASYFNTDISSAAGALEAIFTGNAQALKQYGVVMTDVNLKEFAEELGMTSKEYANLSSQDKAMLRFQYVMKQTSDAQGDFARTNDGIANSTKSFQAALSDLMTVIGEQLIPVITPLIQKITEVISKISQLDEEQIQTIVKVMAVVAVLGPLLTIIGSIITSIGGLITIIGAIATPVGAVIVGIGAVIAIGYKLSQVIDENKEKIAEFVISGLRKIGEFKDKVVEKFRTLIDGIKSSFDRLKSFIKLPHFSVQGEWSLIPPKVPKFSIDWYAKAMKNGMILNSPTIFGAMNGKLLGGGESGSETIIGTNNLMNMIAKASKGTTINMTINAKDQNVNQLADVVIEKLVRETQRERLVF